MNRSIQVEGSFGLIKETLKFRKLKIRGKENVEREKKKVGNIFHKLKKEA